VIPGDVLVAEWRTMELLSLPFRIGADGRADRIWQGSDAHAQQQAVQFVSTRVGELAMSPLYGLQDPSFRRIDAAEVVVGMATFHPGVSLNSVYVYGEEAGMGEVVVEVAPVADTSTATAAERSVVFNA